MIRLFKNPGSHIGQHVLAWCGDASELPEWCVIVEVCVIKTVEWDEEGIPHLEDSNVCFKVRKENGDELSFDLYSLFFNWADWHRQIGRRFLEETEKDEDRLDDEITRMKKMLDDYAKSSKGGLKPDKDRFIRELMNEAEILEDVWKDTMGVSTCGVLWHKLEKKRLGRLASRKARTSWQEDV